MSTDFIRPVDLKLARAHSLAQGLVASIQKWGAENPITARCELREGRLGYNLIVEDFTIPPLTGEWGLLAGECIHNLRSALDNLAFSLARLNCDPPKRPKHISFPIAVIEKDFKKGAIDQLSEEAAFLIERLQPYHRNKAECEGTPEQDPLGLLNLLNNLDKHQVPAVVIMTPEEICHDAGIVFQSDEDASANVPPDVTCHVGPIEAGNLLMEYRTTRPIQSASGKMEQTANVKIQIKDGFEGVDEVLFPLCDYTKLVVEQFRCFFKP